MEHDSTVDKHPRRLVVGFGFEYDQLIQPNGGDRPQLVHTEDYIDQLQPSPFVRFARRLGLGNVDKRMLEAVGKAHRFITSNYAPGDQVVLALPTFAEGETDYDGRAAEMLAWHLYNGTSPSNRSETRLGTGGNRGRIPIYAVVARVHVAGMQSTSSWSDEWKLRLPPGIEHIIFWEDYPFQSCSSRFDQDGTLTLRELRFSSRVYCSELQRDLTKHVLYHEQDELPKWDKHPPVWTHVLGSSSRQAQDILPAESTRPAGMYHHELRSYQGLPGKYKDVSMMVLKATRNGERLES